MSGPKDLQSFRQQIDSLDDGITELLEKRAALAKQVGDIKRADGMMSYTVLERQAEILRRVSDKSDLLKPHIVAIYNEIIAACLAGEKPASVAYLGPEGTNSHKAALKMFGHAAQLQTHRSIGAVVSSAEKSQCDFAVVPFENSAAGTVGETMDLLALTPLFIVGECILRIHHHLLVSAGHSSLALNDVREVYGHPQALAQCRKFLDANLPQARRNATDSTAAAAKLVGEQAGEPFAAIGTDLAKEIYGLAELAANIEDFGNNSTRFLVLGERATQPMGDDKTSFIMTARHEAGAMYHLLKPLAENNVNMTKLESRPSSGGLWEYLFFVDVSGHQEEEIVKKALAEVKKRAASLKILGSYPRTME